MDSKHKRVAIKSWQSCSKLKLKELCMQRVKRERGQLLWKIRSIEKPSTTSEEVVVSALGEILSDEINKISKQSHKPDDAPSEQDDDTDMQWEYEPTVAFSELSEEDYEELMITMQHILHEDTQTELLQRDMVQLQEYENSCELEEQTLASLLKHAQNEQVDRELVRTRLMEMMHQHYESGCQSRPSFCIDDRFGITALYLQCSLCDAFDLLL